MTDAPRADALVVFGITGDLAREKIIPALQAMVRHGDLDVPIVGVARSGWNLEKFQAHVRAALEEDGSFDEASFGKLASRLRYVDGDYTDPETFDQLKEALDGHERPLHYLAIPPSLFETVIQHLARVGLPNGSVVVEKPFGRDLASAQRLNEVVDVRLPGARDLPHRPLPGQGARAEPRVLPVREHVPRAVLEPATTSTACRSRWPRASGCGGRGALLRQRRRDPRRGAEPPAAGHGVGRDGSAGRIRSRRVPRGTRPPAGVDPAVRAGATSSAGSSTDTATRTAWRPAPGSRRTSPCAWRSRAGGGPACRSTSAPASGCRSLPPRSSSS